MWGIIGMIIIPFALFGLNGYLSGSAKVVPAVVNGVDISSAQLTRAVQTRKQQLQKQLGANYRPDMFPTDFLRQQVLNDLVSRQLIAEFTVNSRMVAAPELVLKTIKQVPQFKDDKGKFSAKKYSRAIKGAGRNKAAFEAEVARDIVLNQLRAGIFNSSFVLPYEIKQTQSLLNQQREIAYLKFSKSGYKQNNTATDEELKKYYETHLAAYKTEDKVNVEYAELNIDDMASKVEITDQAIEDYYKANLTAYTEKDYSAALATIKDIRRRISKGESFEELAKQMSDDKLSGKKGGDIGFISKGIMDKAFDAAAFTLKKGQVSQPVKDKFGYHLIKVEDIKGDERQLKHIQIKAKEKARKLDAALRAQIKKELQLQEAEKTFFDDVEKFSTLAYENPESLDAVAAGLDLKIKTTGLVTRRGLQGVLSNPQVLSAIYSDEVLNKSKNSDVIEIKETHMIVVRVKEHKPAAQKPFEEVKEDVARQVAIEKQIEAMRKDVNTAYEKLLAGSKGKDVAVQLGHSEWFPAKLVSRRDAGKQNIPPAVTQKAFSLASPSKTKPSVAILDLANGDQAIVVVSGVKEPETTDSGELQAISQQLNQINTNAEYTGFENYLKQNADIRINLEKDSDQTG